MRIHLHDFSGHPFQAELSRELASTGHEVVHSFSTGYVSGKGALTRKDDDPSGLSFLPVTCAAPFSKYSVKERIRFELSFARELVAAIGRTDPDVVVICNLPLFSLRYVSSRLRARKVPWVLWHQDIFAHAMADEARRRLPAPAAALASRAFDATERRACRSADHVVCIGPAFEQRYRTWGVDPGRTSLIPNWAPLDEIHPTTRDNPWAERQALPTGSFRMLYSGTLGRKHNPLLLLELVRGCVATGIDVDLTVISEGEGAQMLADAGAGELRILPFQDHAEFADVLSSADLLVCLLEPSASQFSIPSKVLSYLAAGRPVLGLMDEGNPATQDILDGGGLVLPPTAGSTDAAVAWIETLAADPELLLTKNKMARELAEQKFDVAKIARHFAAILAQASGRPSAEVSASGAAS